MPEQSLFQGCITRDYTRVSLGVSPGILILNVFSLYSENCIQWIRCKAKIFFSYWKILVSCEPSSSPRCLGGRVRSAHQGDLSS
jgi:hypothetical protein